MKTGVWRLLDSTRRYSFSKSRFEEAPADSSVFFSYLHLFFSQWLTSLFFTSIISAPSPMSMPSDPDMDIVSSDGVQFRVRKSLLSQASPVFNDMFSVPQPISSLDTDAPTDLIKLTEPSKTIRLILGLVNSPITSLLIDSLSDIANLLQAADKYDMKTIQEHALYSLKQPRFLENEPLLVYVIASRYGAHDTAVLAARRTLQHPLLQTEYFSELEMVDGGTIYRVLRYHKQCTTAAIEVATNHTWIRDKYVFFDCPGDDDNDDEEGGITFIRTHPSRKHKNGYRIGVSVHPWWTKFMDTTKVALLESVCSETIRDNGRVMEAISSASRCSRCVKKGFNSDFFQFLDAFVSEVVARVNKVSAYVPLCADSVIHLDVID